MLRIRLTRVGKRKQPAYRIVVADSRAPRDGAFLRIIGHYNPLTEPATLVVKEEEAVRWLQQGAQPSDTAAKLLTRAGVMEKAGRAPVKYQGKDVPPSKKAKKEEAPEAPAATAAAKAPAPAAEAPAPAPAAEAPAPAPAAEAPAPEPAAEAPVPEPAAEAPVPEPAAEAPAPEPAAEAETPATQEAEPTE